MTNIIIVFITLFITTANAFSQGYYFNIDKEQFWDNEGVSEKGICDVKQTYIFDWGNKKIIEREDLNHKFTVYDVYAFDVDEPNNKEIWFFVRPNKDSMMVLIDFADLKSQNIILGYFHTDLSNKSRLWQHVIHFREFTENQIKEFVDNLYK